MIVVGGIFEVLPEERDEFLTARIELMRHSRSEEGCLEYTFAADPADPTRVVLFERWEGQANLDAHMAAFEARGGRPGGPQATSSTLTIYEVSGERPF